MKHTRNLFWVLALILTYVTTVFAGNDLVWDGGANKTSKYLFFAPSTGGAKAVYQSEYRFSPVKNATLKQNFSANTNTNANTNIDVDLNININMVKIFGGCIVTSQNLETDLLANEVCVDDFYISDSEVTNAQYNEFLLNTGTASKTADAQKPVVNISWQDAVSFTQWMSEKYQKNYVLPSIAQWKYATNADGQSTKQNICSQANAYPCQGNVESIIPVKSLTPSEWGLYDMYGNVWEWVIDQSGQKNIAKGGSWRSSIEIFNLNYKYTPKSEKTDDVGFRIVRTD